MPGWSRRDVLRVSLLGSAITLAGCRSRADADGTVTTQTTISHATATDRALSAEADYVQSRLDNATCLESWDIGEHTMDATATVIDQTDDGPRVEVRRPYSYTTNSGSVTDIATHATYLVEDGRADRLSGEGVDPC